MAVIDINGGRGFPPKRPFRQAKDGSPVIGWEIVWLTDCWADVHMAQQEKLHLKPTIPFVKCSQEQGFEGRKKPKMQA